MMDESCVLYEFHGLQIVLSFSETFLKMRQKTFHIYTIKSFYSYARVSTIVLFSSHHFFFSCLKYSNPCSSCKRLSKVVGNMWWEEIFYLILFHFYFQLYERTASGFFFSTAIFFLHKLALLFDLLEFYKGINMHVDKKKHMNEIYLDFLRPLTIFTWRTY